MANQKIKDRIVKLKHKYDKTRTTFEVAKSKRKETVKEMKKYSITPDTIDKAIKNMENDKKKKQGNINKVLDKVDASLK